MGVIQDTYLKYEAAGDQYVGRVVCGLPLCSAKFDVLPPQLVDCSLDESKELVKCIFSGIISHLYCACNFFAASLLFHFDKVKSIVSPKNSLLIASFLTSNTIQTIRSKIKVSYASEESSLKINVFCGTQEQEHG